MRITKPKLLPICYFPTTIFLLDDSVAYTSAFLLRFGHEFSIKTENDPEKALETFNSIYHQDPFWLTILNQSYDKTNSTMVITTEFENLHKIIYNPDRFKQVTVILTDYDMPALTGGEFSRQVKASDNPAYPRIKIIMLTGGLESPVEFQGDIDAFYKKGDSSEKLIQQITQMQKNYFEDASLGALHYLTKESKKNICLTDEKYMNLVQNFLEKNKIVEYYFLEKEGSLLGLDKQANLYWLLVYNEQNMQDAIEFAKDHAAPSEVVEALKLRKKLLYIPDQSQFKTAQNQPILWGDYLHPVETLEGQNKHYYFYSFVKDLKHHNIERNKILSFEDYLVST